MGIPPPPLVCACVCARREAPAAVTLPAQPCRGSRERRPPYKQAVTPFSSTTQPRSDEISTLKHLSAHFGSPPPRSP